VDDLSSGKRENVPQGARFYEMDVRSGCAEVFEEFQPQVLCHQAAQMDVRRSVREPDFDADVNVIGTTRLLENCVEHGVRRVLFASTGGATYGQQQRFPAAEDHPQYPVSPYGVSKLAAERYLYYYHVQYGISYAALRYANVYGPRQDPHGEAGVVAIFCGNLAEGKRSRINGTGEQTRDYVYVGDVARANILALEDEVPSGRTTSEPDSKPTLTGSTSCCEQSPARTYRVSMAQPNRASRCAAPWIRRSLVVFWSNVPRWILPRD
jgi:UDP-glucose 4-epimerase